MSACRAIPSICLVISSGSMTTRLRGNSCPTLLDPRPIRGGHCLIGRVLYCSSLLRGTALSGCPTKGCPGCGRTPDQYQAQFAKAWPASDNAQLGASATGWRSADRMKFAIGVMEHALSLGLREIPQKDVAIVGCDGLRHSRSENRGPTTIVQPVRHGGRGPSELPPGTDRRAAEHLQAHDLRARPPAYLGRTCGCPATGLNACTSSSPLDILRPSGLVPLYSRHAYCARRN